MGTVCQKCGFSGFDDHLVYCKSCGIAAEHRYCLDKLPKPDERDIQWSCFKCRRALREAKDGAPKNRLLENGEENQTTKLTRKGTEHSILVKNRRYHPLSTRHRRKSDVSASDLMPVDIEVEPPDVNKKPKRRKLILKDDSEDEDTEVNEPSKNQSGFNPHPAWRGYFDIHDQRYGPIAAHEGTTAPQISRNLPQTIHFEKIPRSSVWPKSLKAGPPAKNNTLLYFFPGDGSSKVMFHRLLDELIVYREALKFSSGEDVLLVFSSLLMPPQSRLIEDELYMWGVFLRRESLRSTAVNAAL